jgi:hypothetical protein
MSQHTELIARLLKLLAEVEYYPEEYAAIADAIDALQALERQKQPDDLEQIIDAFVEDYEMVGEDEDGRDACHTPTEGERALIKDAICGLLADPDWDNAWGDLIRYQAQQRTEERVPMTEETALKFAHRRATTYTHRSDPLYHSYAFVPHTLMDFVRDLEAHHGITPPESKG